MSISAKEKAEAYKKGVMSERRRILQLLNTLEISYEEEDVNGDAIDLMFKIDWKMALSILDMQYPKVVAK